MKDNKRYFLWNQFCFYFLNWQLLLDSVSSLVVFSQFAIFIQKSWLAPPHSLFGLPFFTCGIAISNFVTFFFLINLCLFLSAFIHFSDYEFFHLTYLLFPLIVLILFSFQFGMLRVYILFLLFSLVFPWALSKLFCFETTHVIGPVTSSKLS